MTCLIYVAGYMGIKVAIDVCISEAPQVRIRLYKPWLELDG